MLKKRLFCLLLTGLPLFITANAQGQGLLNYQQIPSELSGNEVRDRIEDLFNQAQQAEAQGQFRRITQFSQEAIDLAETSSPELLAPLYGQLGNGYLLQGELAEAVSAYEKSWQLDPTPNAANGLVSAYRRLEDYTQKRLELMGEEEGWRDEQQALLSEGRYRQIAQLIDSNISQTRQQLQNSRQQAKAYAERALMFQPGGISEVQAQVNAIELGLLPRQSVERTVEQLALLPDSPQKVFLLQRLSRLSSQPKSLLEQALSISRSLGNTRLEALSLLEISKYYKEAGFYEQAITAATDSQRLAQEVFAEEVIYEASSVKAKIYQLNGNKDEALESYGRATRSLDVVRRNLLDVNQEVQLEFREQIEPFYRDYLALLLERGDRQSLETALEVVDRLKLAQLENYFGSPCAEITDSVEPQEILARTNTALITTIILPERSYAVFSSPNGQISHHSIEVSQEEIEQTIQSWRFEILNFDSEQRDVIGQKLYGWFVAPFSTQIEKLEPETLIFNNDGLLRNVPMAALYDGERYLVETVALGNTLGLALQPIQDDRPQLDPLLFGVSVPRDQDDEVIINVEQEIEAIHQLLGGRVFLNSEFTKEAFTYYLGQNYPLLHLGTHGVFGGTADTSYLLAYDEPISLNQLESLLRSTNLELLVLSACETASGNERAVLGMAGVVVRNNVESAVGSLWRIPDTPATVEIIVSFYEGYSQGMTIAEALRQAQVEQINNPVSSVSLWSSIVLLGRWQ